MANTSVTISEETTARKSSKTCEICEDKSSKYCCPRCNIYYCSLDCYKSEKHADCSEEFYKQCVNDELASNYTDDESRNKMIEILKRMNGETEDDTNLDGLVDQLENGEDEGILDSDDEVYVDLEDRIKGLNLDDADAIWDALTESERQEFEALLNQGNIGNIVPQWDPWWTYRRKEKKVEEVSQENDEETEHMAKCPPLKEVPKLSTLTKVQPSPAIRFNIANCIAAYAFTARYFNGDLSPVETVSYVLEICCNLGSAINFEDPAMAVETVVQKCLQSNLIQTDEESLDVTRQDIFQILEGPSKKNHAFYCQSALSHLHQLFTKARKELKNKEKGEKSKEEFSKKFPEPTTEHLPKLDAEKVKFCLKKLEYYLAFLHSCDDEVELKLCFK